MRKLRSSPDRPLEEILRERHSTPAVGFTRTFLEGMKKMGLRPERVVQNPDGSGEYYFSTNEAVISVFLMPSGKASVDGEQTTVYGALALVVERLK